MIQIKEKSKSDDILNFDGWSILPEASRAGWVWVDYVIARYLTEPHKDWGIITGGVVQNKDNKFRLYFTVKDNSKFEFTLKRFLDDPELLKKLESFITETKNTGIQEIKHKPLSTLSNEELAVLLDKHFEHNINLHRAGVTLRLLDRACIAKLRQIFRAEKNPDEFVAKVAVADRLTFSLQEEISILNLAIQIKKATKTGKTISDFAPQLKKIADAYEWSTLGYYDEKAKTLADYEHKLTEILGHDPEALLKSIQDRISNDKKIRNEITGNIKDKTNQMEVIIAGESTYLKDYFKSSVNELQFYGEAIFKEVAKRTGLPISTIKNLLHDEVSGLLCGKTIDIALVDARAKHSVFVGVYGGKMYTFIGKDADMFEKQYLSQDEKGIKEFKGRVACKGFVTGNAKVVLNSSDFKKLDKGDILVVMNTSPDFVPILAKSAAIISEEGGLTAHVSVISRELGIPCVVGIPYITRAIKDGDYLEVDANKGVIKVLKK